MNSFFEEDNIQTTTHDPSPEIWYPENIPSRNMVINELVNRKTPHLPTALYSPLKARNNRLLKRSFDILLSIILILTLLSWLIPLFAILIKFDSRGPVFFRQNRNRNGGKLFRCIKFRTMFVNGEADLQVARINDNRITRFGRFLRRHHLDELPQLFNVLTGDMSVIGPRPYMVIENLYYENLLEAYSYRHSIKPGITGLAQSFGYFGSVYGRKKLKERLDLDILYIHNWSFGLDLKILYRTFMMIFDFEFRNKNTKIPGLNKTF
jgi:putative colanic acid biosysnthesis UDP-glucose lipid carrier transferase